MLKNASVVMLTTNKESKLAFFNGKVYLVNNYSKSDGQWYLGTRQTRDHLEPESAFEFKHLYFTTQDKIRKGEWYITTNGHVTQALQEYDPKEWRVSKIVATTEKRVLKSDKTILRIGKRFIDAYQKADGNIHTVQLEFQEDERNMLSLTSLNSDGSVKVFKSIGEGIYKLTDRQAGSIREAMGQIMTNVKLIKQGKLTTPAGKCRYERIDEVAAEVDEMMRNL